LTIPFLAVDVPEGNCFSEGTPETKEAVSGVVSLTAGLYRPVFGGRVSLGVHFTRPAANVEFSHRGSAEVGIEIFEHEGEIQSLSLASLVASGPRCK
jgi:hypothetical protein